MSGKETDKRFKEIVEDLTDNTQVFVRSNIKVLQLEIYERTTNLISSGISVAIIVVLGLFILFFLNFGIAQFIGEQLGRPSFGYLIVAGFYLVALIVFLILKKVFNRKNQIKNAILRTVSKEHTDFEQLLEEQKSVRKDVEDSLAEIQNNVADLKIKIYGTEEEVLEQKETYNSVLPRPLLTSSIDFLFRRFIFKKESILKNKLTPLIVELLVSSIIFSEGKIRNAIDAIRQRTESRTDTNDENQ